MAQAKTKTGTKSRKSTDGKKIMQAYKEYVLTEDSTPPSVYLFMKNQGLEEELFYEYFGSFKGLEKHIWKEYFTETMSVIEKDPAFAEFNAREKLLAFYYTLLEILKPERSFVKFSLDSDKVPRGITPPQLGEFKNLVIGFVKDLIREGEETNEIKERRFLSEKYKDGLWLQTLFVLNFWIRDDSVKFQRTDAAIEKSVNLSFDLLASGPLDRMLDFAKFLFQNRQA